MGSAQSQQQKPSSGPPPENGVRVTGNLLQSVVDRTREQSEAKKSEEDRGRGASTSASSTPNQSSREQQQRQYQQQQQPRYGRIPGVPDLSPIDFEAARLAAIDARLASALRKSAAVAKGQLRVEENEVSAVAAAADELLRRCGDDGEASTSSGSPSTPPPPPPCSSQATAVSACFREAAAAKKSGEGGPAVAASLRCRGVVDALESCARKAAAERTEALLRAREASAELP